MTKPPLYAVAGPALVAVVRVLALAMLVLVIATGLADAQEPVCGACLALEITPGQAAMLPARLDGVPVMVRVPGGAEATARDALSAISARGGKAGLLLSGLPSSALPGDVVAQADLVVIDLTAVAVDDPRQVAFVLKTQSTGVRAAARPGAQFGILASGATANALLAQDLTPYLDFVVWADTAPTSGAAPVVWRTYPASTPSLQNALALTATPGVQRWLWRMPPDAEAAASLIASAVQAASALPAGLVPSDRVRIACAGSPAPAYLNPGTLEIVSFVPCASEDALSITPPAPGAQRVRLATGDFVVRVPAHTGEDQFAEGVQVIGARSLTAEEIVARHQAAAARQAAVVKTLISRGTLTMSFEAPGFPAPVSITSETTLYSGGGVTELEQRSIRVNGVEFRGSGVPRLPDHRAREGRVAAADDYVVGRLPLRARRSRDHRHDTVLHRRVRAGRKRVVVVPRACVDRDGQLRDGTGVRCPDALARSDRRVRTDRRLRTRGRCVAARALGRPPDVRRSVLSNADSPGALDERARDRPA